MRARGCARARCNIQIIMRDGTPLALRVRARLKQFRERTRTRHWPVTFTARYAGFLSGLGTKSAIIS